MRVDQLDKMEASVWHHKRGLLRDTVVSIWEKKDG